MNDPGSSNILRGTLKHASDYDFRAFNAMLEQTPGIDAFCSSSTWAESARRAFMPTAPLVVYDTPGAMAVFAHGQSLTGNPTLVPLDSTWILGSSIACPNPRRDIDALLEALLADRAFYWCTVLCGFAPQSSMYRALLSGLLRRGLRVTPFGTVDRCVVRLQEGVEAWIQRRTPKMRASLRRAVRDAENAGIRTVIVEPERISESLFQLFLHIESYSWKGQQHTGIAEPTMATFCREVLIASAAAGTGRALIAFDGTSPVGFVFGVVHQGRYRGVQMTTHANYRAIGLGNALQIAMMKALTDEGVVSYDLGSAMPYKQRWADFTDRTVSLVVNHTR